MKGTQPTTNRRRESQEEHHLYIVHTTHEHDGGDRFFFKKKDLIYLVSAWLHIKKNQIDVATCIHAAVTEFVVLNSDDATMLLLYSFSRERLCAS